MGCLQGGTHTIKAAPRSGSSARGCSLPGIQMVGLGKSGYLNLNEMVGLVLAPDRAGTLLNGRTPVR